MEILYLSPNNMSKQTDTRWWHGHGGGFSLPVIGFCCVIHSISFPQLPLLDLQLHSPTPVTHLINGLWYWPGLDWSLVQKKLGATGLLDTWLRFEDFWLCVQKPFSVGPDCWVQVWIAALFDHKELLWRRHHSHWTTPGSGLPVGPETWMTCFCLWSFVHRGLWPCSVCGRCRTPASLVSGTSCHVTSTLSSSCRSCRDTAPSSGAMTRTAGEFRLNSWICSWGDRLEMTQQSACVCVCGKELQCDQRPEGSDGGEEDVLSRRTDQLSDEDRHHSLDCHWGTALYTEACVHVCEQWSRSWTECWYWLVLVLFMDLFLVKRHFRYLANSEFKS